MVDACTCLDYLIPSQNGFEVLPQKLLNLSCLRNLPIKPNTKVIAMTQDPRQTQHKNDKLSGSRARSPTKLNRQRQKIFPHHDPSQDGKSVELHIFAGDCTGEDYKKYEEYFDCSEGLPEDKPIDADSFRPSELTETTGYLGAEKNDTVSHNKSIESGGYTDCEQTARTPSTTSGN